MEKEILIDANDRMEKSVQAFVRDLGSIRVGRASAALLDRITVDYYGSPTPVNQVAGVSIPEARMLVIQPYDKTIINAIERAIQTSDLGINPQSDGNIIRLVIPPMTEERRKEVAKKVKKLAEDAKVAVRNVRRDANDDLKKMQKAGDISEDALKGGETDIQKATDKHIAKIDELAAAKEKEVLTV